MITIFFRPELDDLDILHERFEDTVISREGDVNWPLGSCDLTPLDFFFCGGSRANITHTIGQIQHDLCARVLKLDVSSALHPEKQWRTLERCYIPHLFVLFKFKDIK